MVQGQFALGAGLYDPWSTFLIHPSNPNQCNQVLFAGDCFRFSRKKTIVAGKQIHRKKPTATTVEAALGRTKRRIALM
jgi:hypothetical protein